MQITKKDGVMVNEIQHGILTMYTKEVLLSTINGYDGTVDDFLSEITKKYGYIEAQLWNDGYCSAPY